MSWFDDAMQDFESGIFGGESSSQEKIRKQQQKALKDAYAKAEGLIGGQYYGTGGDAAGDAAHWQQVLDYYDKGGNLGLTPEDKAYNYQYAKEQLQKAKSQAEDITTLSPEELSIYSPKTSYDVEGYTPERYSATAMIPTTEASLRGPSSDYISKFGQASQQDPSRAALAQADTQGMSAQRGAIEALENVYNQGGLNAIDRARLEEIRKRNQMQERASREAIMADMERRGQGGSGVELAAKLANQQGSAERMGAEGLGVEALAEERQLQAMREAGGLGQQLASDVFGREYQTGAAQDVVNQFNTLGNREVDAATRAAQQQYADWLMGGVSRDADRLTGASEINTGRTTDASRWGAESGTAANLYGAQERNAANQWGANTQNQSNLINTTNRNQALADAINYQQGNVAGRNAQQANLANLGLGYATGYNQLKANQPTNSYGLDRMIELGKTAYSGAGAAGIL